MKIAVFLILSLSVTSGNAMALPLTSSKPKAKISETFDPTDRMSCGKMEKALKQNIFRFESAAGLPNDAINSKITLIGDDSFGGPVRFYCKVALVSKTSNFGFIVFGSEGFGGQDFLLKCNQAKQNIDADPATLVSERRIYGFLNDKCQIKALRLEHY